MLRIQRQKEVIIPKDGVSFREKDKALIIIKTRNIRGKKHYEFRQVMSGKITGTNQTLLRRIRKGSVKTRQLKVLRYNKNLSSKDLEKIARDQKIITARKFGFKNKKDQQLVQIQTKDSKDVPKNKFIQVWLIADVIDEREGRIYKDRVGFSKSRSRSEFEIAKAEAETNLLTYFLVNQKSMESGKIGDKINDYILKNKRYRYIYSRPQY